VDAENPRTGEMFKTAKAYLTFVAIDEHGKPKQVPGLDPETPDEVRRFKEGQVRKERRLAHKSTY
jgi:acyl-CoA hydrolase